MSESEPTLHVTARGVAKMDKMYPCRLLPFFSTAMSACQAIAQHPNTVPGCSMKSTPASRGTLVSSCKDDGKRWHRVATPCATISTLHFHFRGMHNSARNSRGATTARQASLRYPFIATQHHSTTAPQHHSITAPQHHTITPSHHHRICSSRFS